VKLKNEISYGQRKNNYCHLKNTTADKAAGNFADKQAAPRNTRRSTRPTDRMQNPALATITEGCSARPKKERTKRDDNRPHEESMKMDGRYAKRRGGGYKIASLITWDPAWESKEFVPALSGNLRTKIRA
jgi:hypothetical protein